MKIYLYRATSTKLQIERAVESKAGLDASDVEPFQFFE